MAVVSTLSHTVYCQDDCVRRVPVRKNINGVFFIFNFFLKLIKIYIITVKYMILIGI